MIEKEKKKSLGNKKKYFGEKKKVFCWSTKTKKNKVKGFGLSLLCLWFLGLGSQAPEEEGPTDLVKTTNSVSGGKVPSFTAIETN